MALSQSENRASNKRAEARQEAERAMHAARQEAAQSRKEEKRKKDRERLLQESDPDRARRMEVRFTLLIYTTYCSSIILISLIACSIGVSILCLDCVFLWGLLYRVSLVRAQERLEKEDGKKNNKGIKLKAMKVKG